MKKAITLLSIILLFSCSNMIDSDQSQNFDWLDVENPTENLSELSPADYNRVMTAMERVEITFDSQGVAILQTKSAKEINVSSDIYRYILQIIKASHTRFGGISKRPTMLTRSETEEGNNSNNSSGSSTADNMASNCVAISICKATGLKQSYVENVLTNKYGTQGVPLNRFEEALSIFASWMPITPSEEYNSQEFGNKAIMVYDAAKNGNSHAWHAVNVNKAFIGFALGNDFQNPTAGNSFDTLPVEYSKIKFFYKLDKVHEFGSECYE